MKTLNLNDFGVQEMNAEEMRKTEGGIFIEALLVGIAAGLVVSFCDNFGEFVSGYKMTPLNK